MDLATLIFQLASLTEVQASAGDVLSPSCEKHNLLISVVKRTRTGQSERSSSAGNPRLALCDLPGESSASYRSVSKQMKNCQMFGSLSFALNRCFNNLGLCDFLQLCVHQ